MKITMDTNQDRELQIAFYLLRHAVEDSQNIDVNKRWTRDAKAWLERQTKGPTHD